MAVLRSIRRDCRYGCAGCGRADTERQFHQRSRERQKEEFQRVVEAEVKRAQTLEGVMSTPVSDSRHTTCQRCSARPARVYWRLAP